MKKILLIFALLSYLSSFSQDEKIVLKTEGYYYSENKKLKKDFPYLKWLNSLKDKDTVYSIKAIILDKNGSFSTSDDFYGIINKRNNFLDSHLKLQKTLKEKSTLLTEGKYYHKGIKIKFEYKTYDKKNVEMKGSLLNDSTFILTDKLTYFDENVTFKEKILDTYRFIPFNLKKKILLQRKFKATHTKRI